MIPVKVAPSNPGGDTNPASSPAIRGDLGAVRLLLSTEQALDIGVRLQEALVGGWSADFKKWVAWGLPATWEPVEAHFEFNDETVTIKSGTRGGRVALELKSPKSLIAMTLDPAVAFKFWRVLCQTSG